MFTNDGILKMSDFGVAEEISDFGESDALSKSSGSPAFQPPEVASGCNLFAPAKVDVWAVGIVLYIMVVGKYPFSGNNVYTLYESISKGEYTVPEALTPPLVDLIQGILQVDPRRRLSIQQIKEHTWVTTDIESDEPHIPLGMFPPSAEERTTNIFSHIGDREEDDGFFVTDDDDDFRIKSGDGVLRQNSGDLKSNNDNIYNNSGSSSRRSSKNITTTNTTNSSGSNSSSSITPTRQLRCSVM